MQYKQSNSTWINEDTGVLNVGPDEILDKDIVVWATCTIGEGKEAKTYSGSLALHLVSGTQEDTSIKPVFNGNQPTSVLAGTEAQYSAYATNSVIGVEWAIEGNTSANTKIEKINESTAQLTVSPMKPRPPSTWWSGPSRPPASASRPMCRSSVSTPSSTWTARTAPCLLTRSIATCRKIRRLRSTNDANIPTAEGWSS